MSEWATVHATLIFERVVDATSDQVFSAYADIDEREKWAAPSENTALIYDQADFREGGEDVFRCGPKSDPNVHGRTRSLDVAVNRRIVSTETISVDGRRLCASLTTLELNPDGNQTKLKSTIQLVSFVGQDMVKGHENGTNDSLDNLVDFFSRQTAR